MDTLAGTLEIFKIYHLNNIKEGQYEKGTHGESLSNQELILN